MKKKPLPKYLLDKYYLENYGVKVLWKDESAVEVWFLNNYTKFGFTQIKKTEGGPKDPGDYVGLRDGKWERIELEAESAYFFSHKKEIRDAIKVIVCFRKNHRHHQEWKNEEMKTKEVIEMQPLFSLKNVIILNWWIDHLFLKQALNRGYVNPNYFVKKRS